MKKQMKSIFLILIPFALLILSLNMGSALTYSGYGEVKHGLPAYFVEETRYDNSKPQFVINDYRLKVLNIVFLHALLSIPIFISGFLWARSKENHPNQILDPTWTTPVLKAEPDSQAGQD